MDDYEDGQAPQPNGTLSSSRAAGQCWLSHLQLMAVQPACLQARFHQLLPQQQQLPQQVDLQPAAAAVGGVQPEQHEMGLLLHVQAELTDAPTPHPRPLVAAPVTVVPGSPVLPLQLTQAVLDLLILSQHTQVLHQAQYDLLQLVLQQQDQHSELQPHIVMQPEHAANPSAGTAVGELQNGLASLSRPGSHSNLIATQPITYSTAEATAVHSEAAAVAAAPTEQVPTQGTHTPSSRASSWAVPLNLHIAFAAPPNNGPIDYLHLVLTIRNASRQQQQAQAALDAAEVSIAAQQVQASVVAEVPLLVLPAVAQQEVQQLLLPAMRQEVQAEQQQQQEFAAALSDDVVRQSRLVEHTVWTHFSNLASDICLAVQLSRQAGADAASPQAAAAGPVVNYAAAVGQAAAVAATAADGTAVEGAAAVVPAPANALEQVASALLFPLLLPFLTAHGLHNLLQLLISCLPQHLQQQWDQQQLLRLQHLADTAPPAQTWPAMLNAHDAATAGSAAGEGVAAAVPASAFADAAADQGRVVESVVQAELEVSTAAGSALQQQQLAGLAEARLHPGQQGASPSTAEVAASATTGLRHRPQQQQQPDQPAAAATAPQEAEEEKPAKPYAGASSAATAAGGAPVAGLQGASWYSPITHFDSVSERRYIAWKEQSLSYLDYFAALFGLMYLAVLLKRSYSEPTSLFYCLTILCKVLPHIPLILGFRGFFFRHREPLLFSVAPVMLATFIWFLVVQQIGSPEALLPQKAIAAFWSSHGELATSAMRPFTQHMRLRKYILYCLIDAAIMVWVFGQVYGVLPALGRWGFACGLSVALAWGLDLHMRRSFVSRS